MRIRASTRTRQGGIALPIVIVLVLMSALLALWGFRSAVLNEAVVGNDADYQRAYEAAQALLQDAEQDISGLQADGRPCVVNAESGDVCRSTTETKFVDEEQHFTELIIDLDGTTAKCLHGICTKRTGNQDFWNDATAMAAMVADGVGARYGQYTGAARNAGAHPILAETDAGKGGWYWVEILPYEKASPGGGLIAGAGSDKNKLVLHLKPSHVYRITAIARGLKPGTQVVLQSTYVRQRAAE